MTDDWIPLHVQKLFAQLDPLIVVFSGVTESAIDHKKKPSLKIVSELVWYDYRYLPNSSLLISFKRIMNSFFVGHLYMYSQNIMVVYFKTVSWLMKKCRHLQNPLKRSRVYWNLLWNEMQLVVNVLNRNKYIELISLSTADFISSSGLLRPSDNGSVGQLWFWKF